MGRELSSRARLTQTVVRLLTNLPAGAQRMLAGGRRVRIDGQALDPEVQLMLRLARLVGFVRFEELPPEQARAEIKREAAIFAGAPLPVAAVEKVEIPGPAGTIPARLYVPPHDHSGRSPLLVYLHGGGWVVCDLDTHDGTCRFLAREAGACVLAVDYRRGPEHRFPAAVDDALAAFRFATREAPALGADPGRIAVGGDSAGGNLAAVVSLLARDDGGPPPAFQLLIYPVTDLSRKRRSYSLFRDGFFLTERQMDWYRDNYLPDESSALDPRASPMLAPDLSGLAPAHIALAGFDVLRDEGEEYASRLRDASVPVTVSRHSGLIHGFANAPALGRAAPRAMREVAAALRAGLAAVPETVSRQA